MEQDTIQYKVSDSVLANVAKIAALGVDGVRGLHTRIVDTLVEGVSGRLGKKTLRSIIVKSTDTSVTVEMYLIAELGKNLPTIAKNVQEAVKEGIENMMGTMDCTINVTIANVVPPEEKEEEND